MISGLKYVNQLGLTKPNRVSSRIVEDHNQWNVFLEIWSILVSLYILTVSAGCNLRCHNLILK